MDEYTPDKANIDNLPDEPLAPKIVKALDDKIENISLTPIYKKKDVDSSKNIVAILSINEDNTTYTLIYNPEKEKWVGVETEQLKELLEDNKKYWQSPFKEEQDTEQETDPHPGIFLEEYYAEDEITHTDVEDTTISLRDVIVGIAKSLPDSPILIDEIPDIISELSLLDAATIVEKRHSREALLILVFTPFSTNDSNGGAGLLAYNDPTKEWHVYDWAPMEKYDGVPRINEKYPEAIKEHILPHYNESEIKIVDPELNKFN